MSKKEMNTEEKQEKVLTKYDLKVQRREEAKKQAQREKVKGTIIGVAVVVALFAFVVSFPIRSYLTVNGKFIEVSGEKITRVEFDYHYNTVKNNFVSQYGSYMSMYGIDLSGDLSQQMYSSSLTWEDYFQQMAVEDIINKKAMRDQVQETGFAHDITDEYNDFLDNLEKGASEQGISRKEYVKRLYGNYATVSRIKSYVEEALMTTAFYSSVSDEKAPTDDEIKAYYEENKDDYDSVDYRVISILADLPTEPTELADPVEETEETTEEGEEEVYTPSEAEVEFAMEQAYEKALEAEATVATDGELKENVQKSAITSLLQDWLFDEERKQGDTTVIENESGSSYYVLAFEKRYLDNTPSLDARIILTESEDGQAIIDEWKNGEATEDSFAALADKYNDASLGLKGGLYEALLPIGMPEGMEEWASDSSRTKGDVTTFSPEGDTYTYVVYYIGTNDPEWSVNIENTLTSEKMTEYVEEISEGYEVEDPKGNLNYLKVQASEEAAASEAAAAEAAEGEDIGDVNAESDATESSQDAITEAE